VDLLQPRAAQSNSQSARIKSLQRVADDQTSHLSRQSGLCATADSSTGVVFVHKNACELRVSAIHQAHYFVMTCNSHFVYEMHLNVAFTLTLLYHQHNK
jgi:hypothetical protein